VYCAAGYLRFPKPLSSFSMNIRFLTRLFPFLRRPGQIKRFEILLPLNYNDGSLIEPEKFLRTVDELCERFGGINQDTTRVSGTWKYGGTRYRDDLIRMRVDSDDRNAIGYFRAQKETWKDRFQQIDIWITAHEIEII
jgi:hypothetical protein